MVDNNMVILYTLVVLILYIALDECFSTFRALWTTEANVDIVMDHMQPTSTLHTKFFLIHGVAIGMTLEVPTAVVGNLLSALSDGPWGSP